VFAQRLHHFITPVFEDQDEILRA